MSFRHLVVIRSRTGRLSSSGSVMYYFVHLCTFSAFKNKTIVNRFVYFIPFIFLFHDSLHLGLCGPFKRVRVTDLFYSFLVKLLFCPLNMLHGHFPLELVYFSEWVIMSNVEIGFSS